MPCRCPSGLELRGAHNAAAVPQPGAVALHVFGTPLGTCPPGTVLAGDARGNSSSSWLDSSGGSSTTLGAGWAGWAAVDGGADADAGGPFALSANGTVIDLSTSFQPE